MNLWHEVDKELVTPEEFLAVIEIKKGSKNKYELDKKTGALKLDRVLHTSTVYPTSYGFIPRTYADDGDPLDVMVLCSEGIEPLTLVECKPIGMIKMVDQGDNDEKIIAVASKDPFYNKFEDIKDLPGHYFDEMAHFFEVYKQLEGKETSISGIEGRDAAVKMIGQCLENYKENYLKLIFK